MPFHESKHVYEARAQMPNINRMKRQKRDKFDLAEATHMSEYSRVQRPVSRKSGAPIEPAHKFEISLEGDSFSKEKYEPTAVWQCAH